jgi:hypothetical protein
VRRALLLVAGLLAAGCGSAGEAESPTIERPAAGPTDFTIVVTGPEAGLRIGRFRHGAPAPAYPRAVAAFGTPSSRGTDDPVESNLCTVRWRGLGLDMGFATSAPKPCLAGKLGRSGWFGASVYTRRWRTERGLRVGDSVAKLRRLYPRATFKDVPPQAPYWVLESRTQAGRGPVPYLVAETWGGTVLAIRIPATFSF